MPPAGFCRVIAALLCVGLPAASAQPLLPNNREADDVVEPQPVPVDQIIKFSLVGNDLGISSNMRVVDGPRQVQLEGIDGHTRVEVGPRMRRSRSFLPYFELVHEGPASLDGHGSSETFIFAQGSVVRIERKIEVGDTITRLQLRQDSPSRNAPSLEPRGDRVSLQVRTTRGEKETIEDVRVTASSFGEILRKYPSVAARHVGPMLRQFKQDAAVFRVEPEVAWQVFPDAIEIGETAGSKVRELVERLDASDSEDRESATAALEVMGGPVIRALAKLDRASLTAEQNTRIDAVLDRFRPLSEEEISALRDDPHFLLRCFVYSDLQPIRIAAANAAAQKLADQVDASILRLDPSEPLDRRYRAAAKVRSVLPTQQQ